MATYVKKARGMQVMLSFEMGVLLTECIQFVKLH